MSRGGRFSSMVPILPPAHEKALAQLPEVACDGAAADEATPVDGFFIRRRLIALKVTIPIATERPRAAPATTTTRAHFTILTYQQDGRYAGLSVGSGKPVLRLAARRREPCSAPVSFARPQMPWSAASGRPCHRNRGAGTGKTRGSSKDGSSAGRSRSVSTGERAWRSTCSATLPISRWVSAPRPCVPITIRSQARS
jgi:hypothetical protein